MKKTSYRQLYALTVSAIVALALCSTPALAAPAAPDVAIREIFDELLKQLDEQDAETAGELSHDTVREIFVSLLSPYIAYETLARWILRDYWTESSHAQRTAFIAAFEDYIINTYALALSDGHDINLEIKDQPILRNNAAIVAADFTVADADAIPLSFRLLREGDRWQLFDVAFSGVSLARTFRSDFRFVAQNGGIDAVTAHLIDRRKARN